MSPQITYLLGQLATLGPIGKKLPAPGTAGSVFSVILGYLLLPMGWIPFVILTIFISFIGVFAADIYSKATSTHDSGEIIIDEVAGQWVALLFIPHDILYLIAAFILFRLFDITKCWPVNWAERLPGGIGVMVDDLLAGLMAGIILFSFHNW